MTGFALPREYHSDALLRWTGWDSAVAVPGWVSRAIHDGAVYLAELHQQDPAAARTAYKGFRLRLLEARGDVTVAREVSVLVTLGGRAGVVRLVREALEPHPHSHTEV